MPNRIDQYYLGDSPTFRGVFEVDGVEQTPDAESGKVLIMKEGSDTAVVAETAATIVGTQVQYKYTPESTGQYALFFTATFNSGADKRTGVIEFIVRAKESH